MIYMCVYVCVPKVDTHNFIKIYNPLFFSAFRKRVQDCLLSDNEDETWFVLSVHLVLFGFWVPSCFALINEMWNISIPQKARCRFIWPSLPEIFFYFLGAVVLVASVTMDVFTYYYRDSPYSFMNCIRMLNRHVSFWSSGLFLYLMM